MRYFVAVLSVLAGLVASPTSTSAQTEEGASSEPSGAGAEPAPEKPALQLELDDAGVGVTPSPPRTSDGYTLEEAELRVKGARVGVIMSVIPLVVGGILLGFPEHRHVFWVLAKTCSAPEWLSEVE
jgi:hypothetical protein